MTFPQDRTIQASEIRCPCLGTAFSRLPPCCRTQCSSSCCWHRSEEHDAKEHARPWQSTRRSCSLSRCLELILQGCVARTFWLSSKPDPLASMMLERGEGVCRKKDPGQGSCSSSSPKARPGSINIDWEMRTPDCWQALTFKRIPARILLNDVLVLHLCSPVD